VDILFYRINIVPFYRFPESFKSAAEVLFVVARRIFNRFNYCVGLLQFGYGRLGWSLPVMAAGDQQQEMA
jgi:hypothetical protein